MIDRKEYRNAVWVGVIVMCAYVVFSTLPFSKTNPGRLIGGLEIIIFRVFACMWIYSLAKGLGKKPLGYVLATVIIPTIMLIIVGSMGNPQKSEGSGQPS